MRIEAIGLSAAAGGRTILADVSLGIGPGIGTGEFVGLIGANGAGKTTLLRCLAGLAAPAAGRVTYDGREAAGLGRRTLARHIAYLPQSGPVHWALRVEALVMLGRLPHRGPMGGVSAADRAAVERALRTADALHLRGRVVGTLSGGERMRVLLARALATDAAILLADEPVAALDPRHQLDCMALLRDAARRGGGVVAVLHDLTLAARFCDRLVLLSGGGVLADGPPDQVLTDGNLATAYGIAAHRGTVAGRSFLLPWTSLSTPLPKDIGAVDEG